MGITVGKALRLCEEKLKGCGLKSARSDCVFLIAHLLGEDASLLPLLEDRPFEGTERLLKLLKRRCLERVPVSHLIGEWDCLGRRFKLLPRVLTPRPATELLVEVVLNEIADRFGDRPARGLEVGTGSGCIAINLLLEFPRLKMTGIEIDPTAVKNTLLNAKLHGVEDRLELIEGDAFKECPRLGEFDFLVSNPPYVALSDREKLPPEVLYESPTALFGGEDGTLFHRYILKNCPRRVKRGGFIALEFEPFQLKRLKELCQSEGLRCRFEEDFAGAPRILIAERL